MNDNELLKIFNDDDWIPDTFSSELIRDAIEQEEVKLFAAQYYERYGYELNIAQLFFLSSLNDKGLNHYRKILGLRARDRVCHDFIRLDRE
ncbi:hypothetical protein D1872_54770 [compost metagenome]